MANNQSSTVTGAGHNEESARQQRVVRFLLEPNQEMLYATGYALHSYTIRSEDTGWLLVLRVNAMKGGRLVTFIKAGTAFECFELWYTAMHSNSIKLTWHPDKFA